MSYKMPISNCEMDVFDIFNLYIDLRNNLHKILALNTLAADTRLNYSRNARGGEPIEAYR